MRVSKSLQYLIVLLVVSGTLFPVSPTSADLTVESAITRLGIERGSRWEGSVGITNASDVPMRLALEVINLERTAEGLPVPLLDQPVAIRERTLAGWLAPATRELLLGPNESVRVPVTIAIPDFAASGLYTAALLFRSVPHESGDSIATAAAVASAFEVRVGGEAGGVSLVSFGPLKFFWSKGPVTVRAVFANRGVATAAIEGNMKVTSLLSGDEGDAVTFIPSIEGPQLDPISERTFELVADTGPGMYRAMLDADTGTERIAESVYFVVLPWPIVAVLLLAATATIFMSRRAVRVILVRRTK